LSIRKRYFYLVAAAVIVVLAGWEFWTANQISNQVNQIVTQDETDALKQTLGHLATTRAWPASSQGSQKATSYMQIQLEDDLKNIDNFAVGDFTDSLDVQVLGPSSIKSDLSWSYKVYRLGLPLMTIHASNSLTGQDN